MFLGINKFVYTNLVLHYMVKSRKSCYVALFLTPCSVQYILHYSGTLQLDGGKQRGGGGGGGGWHLSLLVTKLRNPVVSLTWSDSAIFSACHFDSRANSIRSCICSIYLYISISIYVHLLLGLFTWKYTDETVHHNVTHPCPTQHEMLIFTTRLNKN